MNKSCLLLIFIISGLIFGSQYDFSGYTDFLDKQIKRGNFPGFVTLISKNGEIIFSDTRGFSDIEDSVPLKEDSLFRIYSMTKPITGVALMILVERGKINLLDPVEKYIPEFKNTKVYDKKSKSFIDLDRSITLLDLATHSSGLTYSFVDKGKIKEIYEQEKIYPYYVQDNIFTTASFEKAYKNVCSFSEKVASLPLVHQPGQKWTYSIGMDILGCVIERASKTKFSLFLQENIFDPLEMKDTFFQVPENKTYRMTNLYGHKKGFKEYGISLPKEIKAQKQKLVLIDDRNNSFFYQKPSIEDGGSGLVSSASDYLKFATMLLNKGSLKGKKILGEKYFTIMVSNQVEKKAKPFKFDPFGMGVTVGIALDAKKMRLKRGNNSFFWGGAASTDFWVDPSNEIVFVNMSQSLGSPEILNKIEKLVYKSIGF